MNFDLKEEIDIITFCKDPVLFNLPLLDTQEVILRFIYQLPMTKEQRQLMRNIIGGSLPIQPKKPHREIVLILGGRSSKTTLCAAISAYEACNNDWRPYIGKGELAWCFVVAKREKQAIDVGRSIIFARIEQSPYLRSLIVEKSTDKKRTEFPPSKAGCLVLKNGAGITAVPCSSRIMRGYPIAVAILDEAAYFAREAKGGITDRDIYEAIIPRQIQFGDKARMMIISSPAEENGLVWDKWNQRHRISNKGLYFVMKAPTWRIRTDFPKEEFKRLKQLLGPTAFYREYGAEFTNAAQPLITKTDLEPCLREDAEQILPKPDTVYSLTIDAAFGERDRFAICVAHSEKDQNEKQKIIVDLVELIEATPNADVHDTAIFRLEELCKQYDIFEIIADQYQIDAFGKTLESRGLNVRLEAWTAQRHRLCYGRLQSVVKQKIISLPRNDDLIHEITSVSCKFLPSSGQYTIQHPIGGHDDLADVVAQVVFELYEDSMSEVGVEMF